MVSGLVLWRKTTGRELPLLSTSHRALTQHIMTHGGCAELLGKLTLTWPAVQMEIVVTRVHRYQETLGKVGTHGLRNRIDPVG
jgi:hypothetical protein